MDETIPFPAAENGEPEKKRRRRGGARRHKPRPAAAEETREAPEAAAPPVLPFAHAAPPVAVGSAPPARAAVDQRLGLFVVGVVAAAHHGQDAVFGPCLAA